MGYLMAGVLVWSAVHLMKSVTPGLRRSIIASVGDGAHKGMVALALVVALALMIFGWRNPGEVSAVYDPPAWGRHLNMLTMFFAILLFGASHSKSHLARWIRHPMLTGMALWAGGHLLANGDSRSVVLFGGLGLWALVSIVTISMVEGRWERPARTVGWGREIVGVLIAIVIYAVLLFAHPWFAGVAVFA